MNTCIGNHNVLVCSNLSAVAGGGVTFLLLCGERYTGEKKGRLIRSSFRFRIEVTETIMNHNSLA